ncbi:MAG: hypothetical protein FJ290_22770 [Planctomycetes bacterium]|nr:hypothetical protein [Planctomycetota bacterium]
MEPDDLDDLVGDPRFVPGIYNYCDAWCDRCPFTERCLNYASREKLEKELERRRTADENAEFWERLDARSEEAAKSADGDEPPAEPEGEWDDEEFQEWQREEEAREKAARDHPAARAAWRYTNMAEAWLNAHQAETDEKLKALGAEPPTDPGAPDPAEQAIQLDDAIEVIRWYQHLIWVKLMRALQEDEDMKELAEEYDFPKDSDGSAKVALIGMDRSLVAWADIARILPSAAESVRPIQALLVRLRRLAEEAFPAARAFKRAGFDEPLPPLGEQQTA